MFCCVWMCGLCLCFCCKRGLGDNVMVVYCKGEVFFINFLIFLKKYILVLCLLMNFYFGEYDWYKVF